MEKIIQAKDQDILFSPVILDCGFMRMQEFPLGFPEDLYVGESACSEGDLGSISSQRASLEWGEVTHFSVLAWRITWMEESGGLQSMGSQRVWTQLSD